jgi:cellulose synthase/poly-beta-1,6-N-acetylglucosamine synthase-like glycosyltransferase
LARLKLPLPLGGTSNHFRTDALRACGGWDPYNVREKVRAFAA